MTSRLKHSTTSVIKSTMAAATLLAVVPGSFAQDINFNVTTVADREVARRQASSVRAEELIAKGDQLMAEKDYEGALAQYKSAYDQTPDSDAAVATRQRALNKLSRAAVTLAEQKIAEGRYEDARVLTEMIVAEGYNPGYKPAVVILSRLEDPEYYNQTSGPLFIASVEEVKKLLHEADEFYNTGRYDMAFKRTEQVLNIDRYNSAARRMQEKINNAKIDYARDAYNEARSRAIWQLDQKWESPVRNYGLERGPIIEQSATDGAGTAYINSKLSRIIIPRLEFRQATVREAVEFLKEKSRELDVAEPDPNRRGVNIVLKIEGSSMVAAPAVPGLDDDVVVASVPMAGADTQITLSLSNIPLGEALRYVANLANLKVKVEEYAVAIVPLSEPTDVLITKTYRVSPGFIATVPTGGGGGGGGGLGGGLGGGDATGAGANISSRAGAREFLESQGVAFPPGSSAYFMANTSQLVVRNTQEQIELIDTLVASDAAEVPTQVEIEAKFVEITQNNLKELGFDWLLGQFNIGGNRVFGGGGTSGTSPAIDPIDFPFVPPGSNTPVGAFPITAGNRSGSLAVSANAIDALLFGTTGASALAPGIFGLSGVFTDPQFQLVIRALDQKKGVDLLSSPKVTTKSGQRAVIEIIREFRYPVEFDPPQIPQDFGGGGSGTGTNVVTVFPVTPTTPTAFETRNTGVTLEVEPVVGSDGYTIDLSLVPQVVEFEGFINYGSPINTVSLSGERTELTPNIINQPIFSTRKVTTSVSLWDGQTISLGGLMREDIQKVEDKVPFLGDLPLIGRAFRSSIDQHIKRNLIIFVTARLINPAGQPIAMLDEEEEVVETTVDTNTFTVAPPEIPFFPK